MLKERDFKKEQKYCANMLGMTQKEYNQSLKKVKVSRFSETKYNDNILTGLGLTKQYLKKRVQ